VVGLQQGQVHRAGARTVAHQAPVGGGLGLAPVRGRLGLAPVRSRLGRKRRGPEGRRCGHGKRRELRSTRNRSSPPSPPQHAQTPPPALPPPPAPPSPVLIATRAHNLSAG